MNLCQHAEFQKGNVHTGFIPEHYDALFPKQEISDHLLVQAAFASILCEQNSAIVSTVQNNEFYETFSGFRLNHKLRRKIKVLVGGQGL